MSIEQGPLAGIRVVDLSANAPGPFCTMVLADLGANVVVVDRPALASESGSDDGVPNAQVDGLATPPYDAFLRNKRRIGIDLKHREGPEVVRRLASTADVMITEMRPGKPESLGIGYEQIRELNPALVYCAITGFGQTGPLRGAPGHDLNYLGHAGVLSLMESRRSPMVAPPNIIADYGATALMATTAILAALHARHGTGRGQFVDLSMVDATTYLLAEWISTTFDPQGNPDVLADYPPYDVYRCADGLKITLGCVEPRFWRELCTVIDRGDLVELAGMPHMTHRLRSELASVFATKPRSVWLAELRAHDLPVGTVNALDDLLDDPQLQARSMILELPLDDGDVVRQVGIGPKFSVTPTSVRRLGVHPGADTVGVLLESGAKPHEIDRLRATGAVFW